jgi:hypothetical protein
MADFDQSRLGDYVDVPSRIAEFRTKHPEGSLQPANLAEPFRVEQIGDKTYIVVVAAAYRSPDDTRPGIGMAYEQWPGRTPYTRDSELQNAETSAWGRAIVAVLAADTKRGIASQEEVRNRSADRSPAQWDPIEQETLVAGYLAEVEDASTSTEIEAMGPRLQRAKRSRELSPASYEKIAKAAAARLASLEDYENRGEEVLLK